MDGILTLLSGSGATRGRWCIKPDSHQETKRKSGSGCKPPGHALFVRINKMKRVILFFLSVLPALLGAQEEVPKPGGTSIDEKIVTEAANAYMAAYNQRDAKALAAMFDDEAQWVDGEGVIHTGKAEIAAMLEAALKDNPNRSLDIAVGTARSPSAGVLLETGTSTVTEGDGTHSVRSYSAVHIKKGEKWLISQVTETGALFAGNATGRLMELSWMIGTWEEKSAGAEVISTVNWTPSRSFITKVFTVERDGGIVDEGTEVIGWDPSAGRIRSWIFESDGGISENIWTQDGNRWLVQARTVLPDGTQATAQHTITQIDPDKFTWSSANRELDGDILPNIEPITIERSK